VLSFLADLLAIPIVNKSMPDVSALGAALLAGLGAGIFGSITELKDILKHSNAILPNVIQPETVTNGYKNWQAIIAK
jgi:glycerol kinase